MNRGQKVKFKRTSLGFNMKSKKFSKPIVEIVSAIFRGYATDDDMNKLGFNSDIILSYTKQGYLFGIKKSQLVGKKLSRQKTKSEVNIK